MAPSFHSLMRDNKQHRHRRPNTCLKRKKMSKSSPRSELHASDSLVLYPFDSASVPSEPPDIRNWFPSYIYESPALNTLDGLQDPNESGETCFQEEKKRKAGENQPAGNSNDALLSGERKSSEEKCNESDESEYSKCDELVTESSEHLWFSSEPPDIKNWFSSYLYESSPLDTESDFTISDYKVREDGKACNAQKSCKQDNKDMVVMGFIDSEESIELPTQIRTSNTVVKCTNLDVHNLALTPMPPIPRQLISYKVSKQVLPGHRTGNSNIGSVKKSRDINTCGKDYDVKLDCSFFEITVPKLSNENNVDFYSADGEYVHKSVERKDCVDDSLEKEDPHEIALPKEDSSSWPADSRCIGKENKETELLGNGFVSTRKSKRENAGNLTRPVQVPFGSLGNVVKPTLRCQKHTNTSRKVLSDTSNFLSPVEMESSGKWCCPQKNKPNLGPPLKQLRLEKWVRRV